MSYSIWVHREFARIVSWLVDCVHYLTYCNAPIEVMCGVPDIDEALAPALWARIASLQHILFILIKKLRVTSPKVYINKDWKNNILIYEKPHNDKLN